MVFYAIDMNHESCCPRASGEENVFELVKAGGWPMVPLIMAGIIALAIIFERFWTLRRREIIPPGLGQEVRQWAIRGKLEPAHIDSLRSTSPLGAVLAAGLDARYQPVVAMRERLEDTGRHVAIAMERYLVTLGIIASAGPLLGLLGTVVGMIQMFLGIVGHGVGDVSQLAGGIGKALVCTATGMVIAIPSLIFYRYFKARIASYMVDIEQEAIFLLDALESVARGAPTPASHSGD